MPAFAAACRGAGRLSFSARRAIVAVSLNQELSMKTTSLLMCGAMLAAMSTFAAADQPGATTRQERIDAALADYRSGQPTPSTANGSAYESTDCSQASAIKRGACKTGHALERGVKKTGNAIGKAGRKTGDALRRTGEKMGGSPDKATSDPVPR
jgi:hypothetical protein